MFHWLFFKIKKYTKIYYYQVTEALGGTKKLTDQSIMTTNGDKEKIEEEAVGYLRSIIDLNSGLKSRFNYGDKLPITDGAIDFYREGSHSKDNLLNRVPVQIKGTTTEKFRKYHSFNLQKSSLMFFAKNHGGIFFVVYQEPQGSQREIFYKIFTTAHAKIALSRLEDKKNKYFAFKKVPSSEELLNIVKQFIVEESSLNSDIIVDLNHSLEDYKSFQVVFPENNGKPIIDSTITDDTLIRVSDNGISKILGTFRDYHMHASLPKVALHQSYLKAGFPNGIFKNAIAESTSPSEFKIVINNFITLTFKRKDVQTSNLIVDAAELYAGKLDQKKLEDEQTLSKIIKQGEIVFTGEKLKEPLTISLTGISSGFIETVDKQLGRDRSALDFDLDLGMSYRDRKLNSQDTKKLNDLFAVYLNKAKFNQGQMTPLNYSIAKNKHLLFYDGQSVYSIFSARFKKSFQTFGNFYLLDSENHNKIGPINPFMIWQGNFDQVPDYSYEIVKSYFDLTVPTNDPTYANQVLNYGLKLIDSYDRTSNSEYLEDAADVFSRISNPDSQEIKNINQIQIHKRLGNLSQSDSNYLKKIISSNESNIPNKVAAAILLEENEEFTKYWDQLSEPWQKDITKFPIWRLHIKDISN
ncbi:hypothetical protein ATX28_09225 [Oenococcus oeni]|uniref:hypothetical protein n=1 Tax=Oenococcus oeni TaxID=1247 RepID=UPI000951DF2C|nr:hypothetical protein [Oenococcus oeni]OLQ38386.1 hypothetical protein ATX28_09225 [Oenococcus oeni]